MIMNKETDSIQNSELDLDEDFYTKPRFRINSRFSSSGRLEKIFLSKEERKYPKGAVIVSQNEECNRVFYLYRGIVEYTYMDINGEDNLMEVLGTGNLINLQPVFGDNPSIATFATLTECTIYSISKDDLWNHMLSDKLVTKDLLEEMALIIGGLNRQLCMSTEKTDKRTFMVLYLLAESLRVGNDSCNEIVIKLSQDELARMIRTTRVTVSKILSSLKQKGVIDIDYGKIQIKDINLLKKMAYKAK